MRHTQKERNEKLFVINTKSHGKNMKYKILKNAREKKNLSWFHSTTAIIFRIKFIHRTNKKPNEWMKWIE